jgi:hypothetical protein
MKLVPTPGVPGTAKPETFKKQQKKQKDAAAEASNNKMNMAYDVMRKMYGMDDED